ncbi:MAG: response regulator [Actinomycetota bacterium]|nr:response regulator [Actinomycetota bacterium]
MKVLLVDDDRELVDVLVFAFRRAGLVTTAAHDVSSGLARFEEDQPDLVVLDLHLGSSNGFDFLRQVRERSEVPIIILTALAGEDDKVKGLSLGADDYVTKPFSHRELLTRIQMRLRRPGQAVPSKPTPDVLRVGDIELDASAHKVERGGRPVNLTVTEFRLLHHLLINAGQVVRTEDILRHVWGNPDPTDSDVLRVTLHRLRRKLGETGAANGNLRTVPGVGVLLQGERIVPPDIPIQQETTVSLEPASVANEPPMQASGSSLRTPFREAVAAPAIAPDEGGRIERHGQDRMRLRFRPDAELESVLFVTPAATLETYDPATDEVTWTMPARGQHAWDVFEVARKRGFLFGSDVDVPTPVNDAAAAREVSASPLVAPPQAPPAEPKASAPTATLQKEPSRGAGLSARAVSPALRASGGLAATRLGRAASAAARGAGGYRKRAPAAIRTGPTRSAAPAAKPSASATRWNIRSLIDELNRRMSGSGRTAAMFIAVAMITALLSIWAESVRLRLLSELERVGEISASAYQQTEARQFILAFALLVLYLLSAAAFLVWLHRSYARLQARRITGLRFNQFTALVWFFVPVAFFFMPRRAVTELWHGNPLPDGGRINRRLRAPLLVSAWWTAFIAFAISAVLTGVLTPEPTITDLFRQTWTNVASDLLAVAAGALAIVVISAIELRQPPA